MYGILTKPKSHKKAAEELGIDNLLSQEDKPIYFKVDQLYKDGKISHQQYYMFWEMTSQETTLSYKIYFNLLQLFTAAKHIAKFYIKKR